MKIHTFKLYVFVYIIPAPLARLAVDLGAQQATCTDAAATRTAGAILPPSSIWLPFPSAQIIQICTSILLAF
jgi:hypothetical protein